MNSPSLGNRPRWRGPGGLVLGAALVVAVAVVLCRHPILRGVGAVLVAEDSPAPVDVLVVSTSALLADTFEVAELYRAGYAPRVFVPGTIPEPQLDDIRALGIVRRSAAELARAVLEHSGVPVAAIEVSSVPVDGTEAEAAVIAAFAGQHRLSRLMIVTARSHSARTRWLLRRLLPPGTALIVRSPAGDPFNPDAWWRSRESAREAMSEYLRWVNTLLGDLWH